MTPGVLRIPPSFGVGRVAAVDQVRVAAILASGLAALAVGRRRVAMVRTYTRRADSRFSAIAPFPLFRWFARVKQRRSEWWLSYL